MSAAPFPTGTAVELAVLKALWPSSVARIADALKYRHGLWQFVCSTCNRSQVYATIGESGGVSVLEAYCLGWRAASVEPNAPAWHCPCCAWVTGLDTLKSLDAGVSLVEAHRFIATQERGTHADEHILCPRCGSSDIDNVGDGRTVVCMTCELVWRPMLAEVKS